MEKETTLIESFNIAFEEAYKWDKNVKVYLITSVDDKTLNDEMKGINGKRRKWNFTFVIPNTNEHLIVNINDGQIAIIVLTKGANIPNSLFSSNDIKIDSFDIIGLAINDYGIKPGKDWAIGFHYTVIKNNDEVIMSVVGLDSYDQFTKIHYSATTGKLISANHKVSDKWRTI